MRFDIRYATYFEYDQLVRENHNELRVVPASDGGQQLIAAHVVTSPAARLISYGDYWGTRVEAFGIREPHVSLEIVAEATVDTSEQPLVTASPTRADLAAPVFVDEHLEYLEPTAKTEPAGHVASIVDQVRSVAGDDVVSTVLAAHRQVNRRLDYQPGATTIATSAEDVLESGAGVCQDYAHSAVAVCRALGVPARYVSGYFFASDTPTGADVEGDVVSVDTHAWFEAAIPGYGWLALDPTNALQVGARHVRIGAGRDYDDVPPIRGVHRGGSDVRVEAGVEMRRLVSSQQQEQQQQ